MEIRYRWFRRESERYAQRSLKQNNRRAKPRSDGSLSHPQHRRMVHPQTHPKQRRLRAFVPGGKVVLLVGGEFIDLNVHGFELELGDLAVDGLGNRIDLRLKLGRVLDQIFDGESLIGEAHVHDRCGMAFGGSEVDEATVAEEIELAAVLGGEFV